MGSHHSTRRQRHVDLVAILPVGDIPRRLCGGSSAGHLGARPRPGVYALFLGHLSLAGIVLAVTHCGQVA